MSYLEKLEDSNHPLLGPTLKGLKLWKIWQPIRNTSTLGFFYNNCFAIFGILFLVSQYVELWLIRDNLQLALRNLSVTMLSTTCGVKLMSFTFCQNDWNSLIEYVSSLEKHQISKRDSTTASIIRDYTKYSRRVTYSYWCLVATTVFVVILAPFAGILSSTGQRSMIRNGTASYSEILSSWLPFDRTHGFGYWISVLEHSAISVYGGCIVACFDSNAVVLMSFFNGQLKLLAKNCARLFGENETVTYDEAMKRIMECHNHHVGLVKFSSTLNSLLSPVMFVYVIICSLMFCASAIQLTMEGTGNMQRIWVAEYLLALIAQLFLYCWHSNELLYMVALRHVSRTSLPLGYHRDSLLAENTQRDRVLPFQSNKADDGVYLSAWWRQEVRTRRSVILLGGQLRRKILFTAGPFTKLTVATFVAIIKGAYSYYTLLNKKEN